MNVKKAWPWGVHLESGRSSGTFRVFPKWVTDLVGIEFYHKFYYWAKLYIGNVSPRLWVFVTKKINCGFIAPLIGHVIAETNKLIKVLKKSRQETYCLRGLEILN
jgi:hypothetical protein